MSFDDLFRRDRSNKMLQITPSRLVAAFTRTSGGWAGVKRGWYEAELDRLFVSS